MHLLIIGGSDADLLGRGRSLGREGIWRIGRDRQTSAANSITLS